MNYSLIAGLLVTLSLFLLFIESECKNKSGQTGKIFVTFYALGVFCWIALGLIMNHVSLIVISSLQIFFLALYASTGRYKNE